VSSNLNEAFPPAILRPYLIAGTFDGAEHTPKLLPCSHTVCLQCLERIVATFARDTGQFRCPICRELITIPRGGVHALPPSFLVNQLLDLMARQRREVIPKCSVHQNQVRLSRRISAEEGLGAAPSKTPFNPSEVPALSAIRKRREH
jgi:ribosomal protein S27E